MRTSLLMFLIAAVLGTLYDLIHVRYGVLTYTVPHIWGTSYWVPLEFGVAGLLGVAALNLLKRRLALPDVTGARLVLDGALLALGYFITGWLVGNNALTLVALLPLAAFSVLSRPTRFVIIGSALAAVIGPLGEMFMSRGLGFFHYNVADWIPYWLPVLWMIAGGLFIDVPLYVLARDNSKLGRR